MLNNFRSQMILFCPQNFLSYTFLIAYITLVNNKILNNFNRPLT